MAISSPMIGHNCVVNPCPRILLASKTMSKNGVNFLWHKTRVDLHVTTQRNSFVVCANAAPGAPSGPPPPSNSMSWILGLVVSFILPFFTSKWGGLWVFKNRIESVVQRVEDVVEAVEEVAEKVDKIADGIIEDLPQGKLRDLVELVEEVAERTAKTADDIDNVIDKVQEAGHHMDDVVERAVKEVKNSSSRTT